MTEHLEYAEASDGTRLALHRLRGGAGRPPLLLVHGAFCNHRLWLGGGGRGLGPALAAAGFDVWLADLRGHGASDPAPRRTIEQWIRRDAPALVSAVLAHSGASCCTWIGHSAGGVVGSAYAGSAQAVGRLGGLVLLGAPGPATLRGWRRAGAYAIGAGTAWGGSVQVPGAVLRLGPEPEPARLLHHWMRWNLAGEWRGEDGTDYLARLAAAEVPLLAIAGAGDLLAPPDAVQDLTARFGSADRTLLVAAVEGGWSADLSHGGLVLGAGARDEVLPALLDWLQPRATRASVSVHTPPATAPS